MVPLLLVLAGCASSGVGPSTAIDGWPTALDDELDVSSEVQKEILDYADEVLADAAEAERWITPSLEYLTEVRGGRLEGLDNRLKKRESLIRKIYTRWNKDRSMDPREVKIEDSVRYLLVVNDSPPGHTDRSVRQILEIMQGIGHQVVLIKNYWPRGDDYSGVNGVLRAPNDTLWELQFHTDDSLAAKKEVHPLYEVYRSPDTSIDKKRDLFSQMARVWEIVPIPDGILSPGSLHPQEEILQKTPP
jgi:hypothetical protein